MNIVKKIEKQIQDHAILLYMKGSPDSPSCGFSARVVKILSSLNIRFAYVDVLQNPDIRSELPKFSNWPTFPQLWIRGELIGGCDIVLEMFNNGELKEILDKNIKYLKKKN